MNTRRDLYWTQGIHRSLQQQPDGIATIFAGRERTFREQADRVARFAGALRDMGVHDGMRVGILGLNSDRYAEALLAIPWADGAFNVVDSMRAPFEIAPMLAESDTRILIIDDAFAHVVPQIREAWPQLRTVIHMGEEPTPEGTVGFEDLIACSAPVEDARRGGDALAGLLHTGGTTALPKAVMHTCHSLLSLTQAFTSTVPDFVEPGTRWLQITPMSHLSGVGACLMQSQFGRTFVPLPRFDPVAVLDAIEAHAITVMFIVPPMLQQTVDHPDADTRDLSSVKSVIYGASPITEPVLERTKERFPGVRFTQLYGMTEAMTCTLLTPPDHVKGQQRRSAGRAAIGTEIRIVEAGDVDVPTGDEGEILLRGPALMHGYWNDPDATAEVMRGGWMHTGDVGRLDEHGYLHVVDRLKDMIIVGGDNVHSAEVENALASHPDVAACAVIGVPDAETGEGVHAVVVPRVGAVPDQEQLGKHCASLVADFKVPQGWEFVDALPTSPNGKVLKRELRRPHWDGQTRQVN